MSFFEFPPLCVRDDRFSADKTPSPFGYSLYKQRESFACLFWDSSALRSG